MNCHRESYASSNCRLCLQDDNVLFDIFEKCENDGATPADIISRLLDPQLSKNDGYPKVCCMECIRKLKAFQSMNSFDLSPSFMLFREQSSIAKAVFDSTYYDLNEIQQHSPISEDHSPLSLDLDSYASFEEQKWHYNNILKAVAQILEAMNSGERRLNLNQSPVEEDRYITDIKSPSQQVPKGNEYPVKAEKIVEQPIKSSVMEANSKATKNRMKKECVNSPRRTKSHNEKSRKKDKEGCRKDRFQCPTCGICCAGRQDLNKHLVVHTEDRPFICSICKNSYRHERNLKRHVKLHSGVKDYGCAHCGKTFSDRSLLKSHLITHVPMETFSCQQCAKTFKRKALLKLHTKVHTKNRPHKCKICGLTFIQRSDLTKHMPVHSGLRKFSCSVCKRAFAHKRNLKDHERIHSKDGRFECTHCGRQFVQKGNLKAHLKGGCPMQRIRVKLE